MKKVNREDLINGWLRYHNTNVDEVLNKHTKDELLSPDWFKLYPCTQEQYNEWEAWAKEHTRKVTKLSNRMINKLWWSVVLDCAPYVKID